MEKNVLIPLPLMKQIIELLEYWDVSRYDPAIRDDYANVMQALNLKMQKIELRGIYSKLLSTDNEDARHNARMEYLWHKNGFSADYCPF